MTVHFLRNHLDAELVITRDVLEAARHAPLAWKPHPSSFSLGRLAMHVATIPGWLPAFTRSATYDMGAGGPGPDVPASSDEILARHEEAVARAHATLDALDDAALTDAVGAAARWRARGHDDAGRSDLALRRAAHGASPRPVDGVPAAARPADPGHVRRLRGSTAAAAGHDLVTAAPVARAATLAAGLVLLVVLAIANAAGYRYGVSDQAFYLPSILQAIDPDAVSARRRPA